MLNGEPAGRDITGLYVRMIAYRMRFFRDDSSVDRASRLANGRNICSVLSFDDGYCETLTAKVGFVTLTSHQDFLVI
jgi:hypothetical protein